MAENILFEGLLKWVQWKCVVELGPERVKFILISLAKCAARVIHGDSIRESYISTLGIYLYTDIITRMILTSSRSFSWEHLVTVESQLSTSTRAPAPIHDRWLERGSMDAVSPVRLESSVFTRKKEIVVRCSALFDIISWLCSLSRLALISEWSARSRISGSIRLQFTIGYEWLEGSTDRRGILFPLSKHPLSLFRH